MRRSLFLYTLTPRAALRVLALSSATELTQASIKKAYIQQALRCHPDLNPNDPNANANFQSLSEALRVALQALELTGAGSGHDAARRGKSADTYDSQAALESLRQSIVAYQTHRDAHMQSRGGGEEGEEKGNRASQGAGEIGGRTENAHASDPFFSPSLEYVSSVCHEETVAMRRVRSFCESLPSVLCGSRSAALFEAVAFFHTHYVASMAECVMRFSQNLPVIVRRVVRNRKQFVRYAAPKSVSGMGTGTRPREQRIEDMAMKPLVLMGALIFDVPAHTRAGEDSSGEEPQSGKSREHASDTATSSSSTCGVSRPDEVEVTSELRCVICPTDSIGSITEKLNKWEAASFRRLKLELAIVDATGLISNLVGLEEAGTALSVPPHLHLSFAETEKVLLTVQKLSCDLCLHYDDHENFQATANADVTSGLWLDKDEQAAAEDDEAARASVGQLIAECRVLAQEAVPHLEGNVLLTWTKETVFVESAEAVSAAPQPGTQQTEGEQQPEEAELPTETAAHVHVARHLSCCTAETIMYGVSVEVSKEIKPFLLRLRSGLRRVLRDAHQSHSLLPDLLALREMTVQEEFIPITTTEAGECANTNTGSGGGETEGQEFRYRGPIHSFPRLYNINTVRESLWWRRLHDERVYVAAHAAAMNPINVFYDCLPYDTSRGDAVRPLPPDTPGGWVGESADGGGGDNAVLAKETLDSPAVFRDWLEDVVEQSSLSREVHTELDRAGIAYISRDPSLPLTNFLSFVRVFVPATAVRGVLENSHSGDRTARTRAVTSDDIGLSIIVGYECGVRDGGRLLIPWYMDPNVLLALLEERVPTPELAPN